MRILLTRPRDDSERLAPRFAELGGTCMIWPLTEIVAVAGPVTVPPEADGLVFTSTNGVRAFAALCPRRNLPVFCVGDRTAAAAAAAGFAEVESAAGTVSDLARLLDGRGARRLFYPRGRDVSANLAALLGETGAQVEERIVYAAEVGGAPPSDVLDALTGGTIGLITIWSRRAGGVLAGHLAANPDWPLSATDLLAISRRAGEPLASTRFRRHRVAATPDAGAMLAVVSAALR